jgi:hypothetical protein
VSNVLVTMLADIGGDRAVWERMAELSLASWRRHLFGPWQHVDTGGKYPDAQSMFRAQYVWLRGLWHDGHNVLFADADTLAVRPVNMFGRWPEMRMFGLTNQNAPSRRDIAKGRYMNAGVMYLPQSMNPLLWELGDALAADWDDKLWSHLQYVFNRMFWAQDGIGEREWWQPEFNYQCPCSNRHDGDDSNGGLPFWDARVLHFHSSRAPERALDAMRKVASWGV